MREGVSIVPLLRTNLPLGIVHFMAYPQTIRGEGPILETLSELVTDPDFSLLEITHIHDKNVRHEANQMLQDHGKRCAFGSQPCLLIHKLNLNAPDEAKRKEALDVLEACTDEAVEMNAEALVFLSGKDPGPEYRSEAMKWFAESVQDICTYAQRANPHLKVILETFDRVPYGKNALVGPTEQAVALADQIRSEYHNFWLMLDLSHLPLLQESPSHALTNAQGRLGHIHIGNCVMRDPKHPAYGDEHPAFGIEDGENDAPELATFLKVLDECGYLNPEHPGTVSFEVKPLADETTAAVITNAKETLRNAWQILGWPEN